MRVKPFSKTLATLRRNPTAVFVALWLVAVGVAMASLGAYSRRAGDAGMPPARWPVASALELAPDRPTLVLVAHPRCPCTRATLGELELLLAQSRSPLRVHVLFIQPAEISEEWVQTDLWRMASRLPGVTVHRDVNGIEARRFQSETSGQVLLYGSDGGLKFQGGITVSRGHAGDNAGRTAILALLDHKPLQTVKTPVFGCSLFAGNSRPICEKCQR